MFLADLQPFRMLIEHRVDDVDEGLVAGEQAVAAGEQISFEPALAQMLAQHLHDAAVDAEIDVDVFDLGHPFLAGDFVDGFQPVRGGLVRAEQPEILLVEIELHHVAQKLAENARRLRPRRCRAGALSRHNHGSGASTAAPATRRHWRAGWCPCGDGPSAQAPRTRRGICRRSSNNSCGR